MLRAADDDGVAAGDPLEVMPLLEARPSPYRAELARRLVLDVPFHVFVARTKVAFLGPRRLFIAASDEPDQAAWRFAGCQLPMRPHLERLADMGIKPTFGMRNCRAFGSVGYFATRSGSVKADVRFASIWYFSIA